MSWPLLHNWAAPYTVETTYLTDVSRSIVTGSEERLALLTRPRRRVASRCTAFDAPTSLDALLFGRERSKEPITAVPLYCDEAESAFEVSGTAIFADTTLKRFYSGQPIYLVQKKQEKIVKIDLLFATAVTDTFITLIGPPPTTYPAGSLIWPVIRATLDPTIEGSYVTDDKVDYDFEAIQVDDSTSLPPTVDGFPTGYPAFLSEPVWIANHNWVSNLPVSWERLSRSSSQGKTDTIWAESEIPRLRFNIRIDALGRAEAWDIIRLFDSRKGRAFPFWFVPPISIVKVKQVIGTSLHCQLSPGYQDLLPEITHLACFKANDPVPVYRQILVSQENVTLNSLQLILDTAVPAGYEFDVRPLVHVCFASDNLLETWATTEICAFEISVIQLLDDKDLPLIPGFIPLTQKLRMTALRLDTMKRVNRELRMSTVRLDTMKRLNQDLLLTTIRLDTMKKL